MHVLAPSDTQDHKTHTDAHEGQYALEREHFMPLLDLLIAGAELEAKRFVVVDALLEASPPTNFRVGPRSAEPAWQGAAAAAGARPIGTGSRCEHMKCCVCAMPGSVTQNGRRSRAS